MLLAENAALTAVINVSPGVADSIHEKYIARRVYDSAEQLIGDADATELQQ